MGLSVAVFGWVAWLGAGDWPWFLLVCALSGAALGADLVLPPALLAGLIGDAGERGRSEGSFMGWWGFATKLNLALAAGLALPLLSWFGYAPGQQDPQALWALTLAYAVLPCVLKLAAAALLYVFFLKGHPHEKA
jgi:Na+/melibiose symporter-like transporter